MNRIKTPYIAIALLFVLGFTACKKERSPRLIVSVVRAGAPVSGAIVCTSPGPNPQAQSGMLTSVVDSAGYVKKNITDAAGEAIFEFEFSAVLDVDVMYEVQTGVDSLGIPVLDTLEAHKVVKIESVRQRDKSNDFKEVLELR